MMMGKTFVEKIFGAKAGTIVFRKPDIVLSHDNTSSIEKIFRKMSGEHVENASQLMVVLDHNAPPTNSKLANDYASIRKFVNNESVDRFYDAGQGICHQLMGNHAKPGMVIVGSDSHTCTAGAFNAFAAGIDRTETAGIWKTGETWFRVPDTIKIELKGELSKGVYAKDLALYIIGMIGSAGANYQSIEYHGSGVATLSISDRMTIANLASEMGAKNAVFPPDSILNDYFGEMVKGIWADEEALYAEELVVDMCQLVPMIACPHHVDNVKALSEMNGLEVHQGLIGTCTNGRLEDLQIAADILRGKKVADGFQLLITPASRKIYLEAMRMGMIEIFLEAGANVLSPSCGPCLGTGQGIPADGMNVISTANRNFLGRMGNKKANVYLASPETVALAAIEGKINAVSTKKIKFSRKPKGENIVHINSEDNRRSNGVWNYSDANNLNTDQMFAGHLTYEVNSSEPEKIVPHLFQDFDEHFADKVEEGDIIVAGENFGCGSSREHPSVGFVEAGIKAVVVKSVSRIFFRSAVNQGLPLIVLPELVNEYNQGDSVEIDLEEGKAILNERVFLFEPLPDKLMHILRSGGLIKSIE
jgi:homoaconitate hydratase family protein/3-isopropylmalate dehydratase small subunit